MTVVKAIEDGKALQDSLTARPTISVCIITYNQQSYIRACIESVIAQVIDADIEILVGDDCSRDDTSKIVAEIALAYPGLVKHLKHETQLGPSGNILAVLKQAKGQYVAHLDGDDFWLPGKLSRQLSFLKANKDCAAVYTNAFTVDQGGALIGIFNDVGDECFELAALLRRGNFLNASSAMMRSKLIAPLLEIEGQFIDYRMHLRHARAGFVAQLGQPLVGYRVNSVGSMVATSNDLVRRLYWEAILDVPRALVSDSDFAQGLADFARRVAFRAVRLRRWSLVREWSHQVFAAAPYGKLRMVFLILSAILRMSRLELLAKVSDVISGKKTRVLYRR